MSILIPYSLLSEGIYSGIVNAIGGATYTASKLVAMGRSRDTTKEIALWISRLDLENKLSLIKTLVNEYIKGGFTEKNSIISQSINNLEEVINNIKRTLEEIEYKQLKYLNSWLRRWRTNDIKIELENLEVYSQILEDRFRYMVNILFVIKLMENKS